MKDETFHILFADDDESDRLIFKEAIEDLKIKSIIHTANNDMELMDYLTKKNVRLPDLIFPDLNMPFKNGLTCLKEIRNDEKLKDISIAAYSTSADEKDIEETFLHGANVYITKPHDLNVLKQVLEKAVMTSYQYQNQSMKRENFLLRI